MKLLCWAVAAALASGQVRFIQSTGHIDIEIGGRPFSTFTFQPEIRKPFLAPLRAASGTIVTRQWPMDPSSKESHDHPHHRGLFFGYFDVNGFDFWSNYASPTAKNCGSIVPARVDADSQGAIHATFNWIDTAGRHILTEQRTMRFSGDAKLRIVDVEITLTAAEPVTFGDDKDGALGIRLADPLREEHDSGTLVNSEGAEHEKNTWGHRAAWMDYYGEIAGEKLGVAMFDHPSNPGYPNRWHCRAYGLFAINPFAQHAFDPALPAKKTPLARGESLTYRWRVVIHPGDVKSANIAELYRQWTSGQ